jgi:hypothetical protein
VGVGVPAAADLDSGGEGAVAAALVEPQHARLVAGDEVAGRTAGEVARSLDAVVDLPAAADEFASIRAMVLAGSSA